MATIENNTLGDLKGKVGTIIGRRRGEKYHVYAAPTEVKISNSEASIKSRNKMKTAARFASSVNSVKELKEIWSNANIEAFDVFHKIEKENFKLFIAERPTIDNFIIPPIQGVLNPITESEISIKGIKLKLEAGKVFLEYFEESEFLTGIGIVCFYNPIETDMEYFHLSKFRMERMEIKNKGEYEFEFPFNGTEQNNYNSYLNSVFYFIMLSKDSAGKVFKWTENYHNEFVHEVPLIKESFTMRDSRP